MKKLFYILIFFLSVGFFFSCKKYPEGGISFNAKKKIIGYWEIESLMVDGIDSTANIKAITASCPSPIIFVDINDHDDYSLLINSCVETYQAKWWYAKNTKQLGMRFEDDPNNGEIYPLIVNIDISIFWDIQKLTKEKLWLKTTLLGKDYYVKLNKKPDK